MITSRLVGISTHQEFNAFLRDALTVERLSENAADTMIFVGAYGTEHSQQEIFSNATPLSCRDGALIELRYRAGDCSTRGF